MVREAAFDASGPAAQRACPCFPRTRMCAEKPECMGIHALRVIPVAGPRRSAPEGGRSPRMLRTRPPLGFPPSRRKSPARSPPTAPPVAAADPCPSAGGAGHPAPRRRDPDGPRRTLPARLRAAFSSALATAPVPPPPPLLPARRGNAAAPVRTREPGRPAPGAVEESGLGLAAHVGCVRGLSGKPCCAQGRVAAADRRQAPAPFRRPRGGRAQRAAARRLPAALGDSARTLRTALAAVD